MEHWKIDFFRLQFSTQTVLEIAGVHLETLRIWIKRGYLDGLDSVNPGRGKQRLYSAGDVIIIAALAELTRLGHPPSHFTADIAELVLSSAGRWQWNLQGMWGEPQEHSPDRYLLLFPRGGEDGALQWTQQPTPKPRFSFPHAWTTIDTIGLADWVLQQLHARL